MYAIYDLATGAIKSLQEKDILAEGEGALHMGAIPRAYIGLHYVVGGAFALRPVSNVVMQGDVVSFFNTHPDATASMQNSDGEKIEFSPQDVKLTSSGGYMVNLSQPFPYSDISENVYYA